jgi:2-succinyl-6-hydroxy-2,4-cyclohexadiene-1-carboxylate synthase
MRAEIVLLHGFTHTGASWDPVIAALPQRYKALAPDIRGHGSAARRPASLRSVVADVCGLAGERFTLAGYSMGGRIALHVAVAAPARVQRLVLIGASPGIEDADERAQRRAADERLADEIEQDTIEAFARRWASTTTVLAGQPASLREAIHQDRLRNTPSGLAAALRSLGTGALPSLWGRLSELGMPVTLVVGERDEKFRGIGAQMASRLPRTNLIVVPDAGHAVHLEAPRAVAEIIASG